MTTDVVVTKRLPIGDASARTGFPVHLLRRAADRGEIPCYKSPGGQRDFSVEALDAWTAGMEERGRAHADMLAAGGVLDTPSRRGRMKALARQAEEATT